MSLLLRVLLLLLGFASFAVAADPTAPTITASSATPGVNDAVTFAATVTANGAPTSVVFEYGRTNAYGRATEAAAVSAAGVAVPVSAVAEGLDGTQTYHFRVVAKNTAGEAMTSDATFVFAPVLTIQPASGLIADHATLHAALAPKGRAGAAFFQYSTSAAFDSAAAAVEVSESWTFAGTENSRSLSAALDGLTRNQTFFFRLVFRPSAGADLFSTSANFLTNQRPVATADTFSLRSLRSTSLDVQKNDRDPDGIADPLLVSATSSAAKGVATVTADGLRVVYAPGADFRGTDAFTYTITDGFPASTATAAVTIRAFGLLLAGNHGGLLVDANGEAVGYFKITTTGAGAFSGSVLVNGGKESFTGAFGSDGKFRGSFEIDGRTVPVTLAATVSGNATAVAVDFDDGRFTAALRTTEASAEVRADLAGRYTVEFPSGTSTSEPGSAGGDPAGSGWAALKLGDDGVARLKGRLADGRSFSTRGVLGIASTGPVVTFFDDPRRTRVAGTLSLDDAVSGTLAVVRDSGGSGLFADGYTLQSTASGARYVQPADGKRAIEGAADASGRRLTLATTGGDPAENFTRELRVDEDDSVTVLDRDSEGLKVKIDRDSGRFTAWFTGSTDDRRIKGTGVFIQGTSGSALGRGAGVFKGENGTGKITISAGGSTTTPDTPPPTTTTR